MPSDERVAAAFDAVAGPAEVFRSALVKTAEELRGYLGTHRPSHEGRIEQLRGELGGFAGGRIDLERLSTLLTTSDVLDPESIARIERASAVLEELLERGDRLFRVDVGPEEDACGAVGRAFADLGRGFGAALVAEMTRTRRYRESEHGGPMVSFPHGRWSPAEREMAPPLVVTAPGSSLQVGGLARYLDDGQKLVLVVDGECPPAPLVRLITPRTLVIQATDAAGLEPLARWRGPCVAALVPESAAEFVHDPAAGPGLSLRLTVSRPPQGEPPGAIGTISVFQQREELHQLLALASTARTFATPEGDAEPGGPTGDAAERVATWLLANADAEQAS